jgi:hypothetical protein
LFVLISNQIIYYEKLQLGALSLEVPELSLEMCKRLMGGGYALELGDYRETERDGYNRIIDGGITITPDEQQQAAMDERASLEEERRQQQHEQQQDEDSDNGHYNNNDSSLRGQPTQGNKGAPVQGSGNLDFFTSSDKTIVNTLINAIANGSCIISQLSSFYPSVSYASPANGTIININGHEYTVKIDVNTHVKDNWGEKAPVAENTVNGWTPIDLGNLSAFVIYVQPDQLDNFIRDVF